MMGFFIRDIAIRRRDLIVVTFLNAFLLAWLIFNNGDMMLNYYEQIGVPFEFTLLPYIIPIFISPAIGFLIDKTKRRKPFLLFSSLGSLSIVPIFFEYSELAIFNLIVSGIAIGIIAPSAYSLFADNTLVRERGRVSGLIISVYGLMVVFLMVGTSSREQWLAILGIESIIAFFISISIIEDTNVLDSWKKIPHKLIFLKKDFLIYLFITFAVGSFFGITLRLTTFYSLDFLSSSLVFLIIITGMIASSFLIGLSADRFGRKPTIIGGISLFALTFMIFVIIREFWALLITSVLLGVVYALLTQLVVLTVFGDLSTKESRGRYYGISASIGYFGFIIGNIFGSLFSISPRETVMTITIFSVLLILIPLTYVKETLPAKEPSQEMRKYAKEAKKKVRDVHKSDIKLKDKIIYKIKSFVSKLFNNILQIKKD